MNVQMLDLRDDAIAEARRLTGMRAFFRASDVDVLARCDTSGSLVARARHRRTRQSLAGRMLLIFRIAMEDATARAIDTALVGILCQPVDLTPVERSRARTRDRLRAIEPLARAQVQMVAAERTDAIAAVTAAFAAAWTRRDRSIAAHALRQVPDFFQAGLFDRRAERAHAADETAAVARNRDVRARLVALEQSVAHALAIELLLVLTP